MSMDRKRLFDDDIQTTVAEAPQPSKPTHTKKSCRNIKRVSRKRRKCKTPTLTLEP